MSWKRTLCLTAALAVLVIFYYSKLYHRLSADHLPAFSVEAVQSYILELKNNDAVHSLSIHDSSKATTILFEKDSNHKWQIVSPGRFPAEPLIVDGFVSLLKLTPRSRHLSLKGLSENDFGFHEPRLKICIRVSGRKDRCLLIGANSVIGQGAYAKWEHEDTYFLVEENFLKAFDKTLYAVRKKQIFNLLDDKISSVHFKSAKHEIEIIQQDKDWILQKPVKSALSAQVMDALLVELMSLYVKEFLDEEKINPAKLKLNRPLRTIQIHFYGGTEQILIQGKEAAGHDAFFARSSEPETIFLISRSKFNHLEESFSKLNS